MQKGLDRRLQDLERKAAPEGPVVFRLVHHGEHVDDGTPVIRLTWDDDIPIHVVDLVDTGDDGPPVAAATPSGARRVDYRLGLHWIAPLEGADDAQH